MIQKPANKFPVGTPIMEATLGRDAARSVALSTWMK